MKFKTFTLLALLSILFALTACQAAEALDAVEPTLEAAMEAAVQEEAAPKAAEEAPAAAEEPAAAYEPVFESIDCWWTLPESQPVECGYLVVPEDRSEPDGPSIRLAVAILRHPGGNPEPDPIIRLHGGPGGGYLKFMEVAYADDASLFPANRDVIAFDQRGVGLSEPALECPNIGTAIMEAQDYEIEGKQLTATDYQAYLAAEAAECFAELSKIANLSAYNTKESAADVNDLRLALGYDEVNIHASSYGTALAQHLMRDFPEHIRSVILDAAILPFKTVEQEVPIFQEALDVTFERCAADEACNAAFPNLREKWLNVLARLNEEPQMIDASNDFTGEPFQIRLDGANATLPLRFMQASTGALPLIPLYIDLVSQGDYAIAAQQWGGFAARTKGFASIGALLAV
jgi:pimeloyl-ACP methyl ester carboxylesterase